MKQQLRLTLLFLGISTSLFAQTQVPNADFESWTLDKPAYNFYAPDHWDDGAACVSAGGPEACEFTIMRTTDAHGGSYAVAQFTIDNGTDADYQSFTDLAGDATFNGPAFTGRPVSMTFYYKYRTNDNQPMTVSAYLYTGINVVSGTIVGTATYSITPQASYTQAEATFTYISSDTPERIFINSDYDQDPVDGLDTLKLDDFAFTYSTTSVQEIDATKNGLAISVSNKTLTSSKLIGHVVLTDLTGKVAISFDSELTEASLNNLKTGLYILTGTLNEQPFTRRILVD
ncbi:MAG TPA: hypothetical protein VNB90_13005 [Cytophagaceae bacterium]|nr:hypothetical protein [Cytophagaceae bacterium]